MHSEPIRAAVVSQPCSKAISCDLNRRFDPDKEIEAMDQKEEKEKRRKQEKTTANNKQGIPSRLNLECTVVDLL